MEDLCSEFHLSKHTIYNYISKGVLPPPKGGRRYAYYDNTHMRVLRAVRSTIHDGRVTLSDMAERLHGSRDDE